MKTAIILHGMPSKEEYFNYEGGPNQYNKHWIPWIQRQLLLNGILTQVPELPEPYQPDYEKWRSVFEQFKVDENTMLIGHSCGGGFLIRWLSENKIRVGRVALVAPWINPNSTSPKPGFFDFQIDRDFVKRTKDACLFISLDDGKEELETANLLKKEVPDLKIEEFNDRGHFTFDSMKTDVFPELKEFLLK